MKRLQLLITAVLFALLLFVAAAHRVPVSYGGVPVRGWIGFLFFAAFIGAALVIADTKRNRSRITDEAVELSSPGPIETESKLQSPETFTAPKAVVAADPHGPSYPHPIINVATCIGCHACVDACPHDVLAIVNGKAAPVALEQCMEDTSCQVECPTVPKSCIVVNTSKKIPQRKVPQRNQKFMTNVPGVYLIGDVSGVPLIKNAINEGGAVIDYICEDLQQGGGGNGSASDRGTSETGYDVAIIGIGPAGLSATALAHQRGLKYIAIEQDRVAATIQQTYQAGKYVYFNPNDQTAKGGIKLEGVGATKEAMLESWMETLKSNGLAINQYESCKDLKPEGDGFLISTEPDGVNQRAQYRARCVILAVGNRGTPMRLKVPGEDLRITITPTEATLPAFCNKCGFKRASDDKFCQACGNKYAVKIKPPYEDEKVKYRLTDPNAYHGQRLIVVGAGNSSIEAAIDLAAYRSEDGTKIVGWRDNAVSLVVRSNFKGDLKLGNKMLIYECIDEGRVTAYFRQTIKEITPGEVALMSARERDPKTAQETARIKNDYIFALIGGEKPTKFLEGIGIKIG